LQRRGKVYKVGGNGISPYTTLNTAAPDMGTTAEPRWKTEFGMATPFYQKLVYY